MNHEKYIRRCFQLARLAKKAVQANPLVGAVLVYNDRIIGEGYHQRFGRPHAEVNAVNNVLMKDLHLLAKATLYVSLEPCCIHSKTPACTDLILKHKIKKVVISVVDPNDKIDGRSVKLLKKAGVDIVTGILNQEGLDLIKPFQASIAGRPYVILKWAQSSDAYIGKRGQQISLSHSTTNIKVHSWRAEVDGILVGHNTAVVDDPELSTRHVPGDDPVRIILTRNINDLKSKKVWKDIKKSIFVSPETFKVKKHKEHIELSISVDNVSQVLSELYKKGITRLLVEGGAKTHKLFINSNLWDEARVITCPVQLVKGIRAAQVSGRQYKQENIAGDSIAYLYRD